LHSLASQTEKSSRKNQVLKNVRGVQSTFKELPLFVDTAGTTLSPLNPTKARKTGGSGSDVPWPRFVQIGANERYIETQSRKASDGEPFFFAALFTMTTKSDDDGNCNCKRNGKRDYNSQQRLQLLLLLLLLLLLPTAAAAC
jgi:hypothetical protein